MDCVNDHLVVAVTDRSLAFSKLSPQNGNLRERHAVALPPERRTPEGVIDTIGDWMRRRDAMFDRIWITCADPVLRQGLAALLKSTGGPRWLSRVALQTGGGPAAPDMTQDPVTRPRNRRSVIAMGGAALAGAAAATVGSSSVEGLASKGSALRPAPKIEFPAEPSPPGGPPSAGPPFAGPIQAPSGATAVPGFVLMDSFAGTTDDAKLAAAMSYAAAQTFRPAIMLPARLSTFNVGGLTPYNGMRIIGPLGASGPKDPEDGNLANHLVVLNVGSDKSAWFNGTSAVYNVYVGDIVFQEGNPRAQFWNQPLSSGPGLYACQFHGLTFYGFQSVFGSPSEQCAMTQVTFTGHWVFANFRNTVVNLAGSDNDFWSGGYANIQTDQAAPAAGTPYLALSVGKTKLGYTYLTTVPGWGGVNMTGVGYAVSWFGPTFEGTSANPANYPFLNVSGGYLTVYGGRFHYLNPASGVNGAIVQSGGVLNLDNPSWNDASSNPTFPLVFQTAGHCSITNPIGVNNGNKILFRESGGETLTAEPGQITYR